jgi:hypothetical protein
LKVLNIKLFTQTTLIFRVLGPLAGTYQPKPVARRPAKATEVWYTKGGRSTPKGMNSVMILPQVHLRTVIPGLSRWARLYLRRRWGAPPTTT